ncbi:glycoside hydrolase family 15 protein [Nocardioides mangrovicus]|uniref:Glycoside hydrolase family 15 protein n=1 Tax=Nocardioides mangrovicus TaxID=2478913 RepID=A0A3L8P1A7_9ACTN|nr:glycoside hydrolase family 15 protein [Nocardioides mangrovicus]RLV48924.1 glycoside hydrolase family 15 protein [Nocardioides mangrovicus]
MPLPIEDYAMLGDGQTACLVGRDGSVDWLCLPRFDSEACLAALLGDERHGRWLLGPDVEHETERRYVGDTSVLETTYRCDTGTVVVTDVMPVNDDRADVVRRIRGVAGSMAMRHVWSVRFDYGRVRPWVHRERRGDRELIIAVAGPNKIVLRGPRMPVAAEGDHGTEHRDRFTVNEGDELTFSLTWVPSHLPVPRLLTFDDRIEQTIAEEQAWADACEYTGPFRPAVIRSLVTLRMLTHAETGGIVAAPTTSLPEQIGGERNWDYRYVWLRDASLTLHALLSAGRRSAAELWRDWLLRAVAGDPEDLQIMYTVDGGRDLPERTLDHLPGYLGSAPVRIGNGAVRQRQSDVLGEVMTALDLARRAGIQETTDSWALQRTLVEELAQHWDRRDHGLWEIRGKQRHFTHSGVMVWCAFDRAVKAVEEFGLDGPVERWRTLREKVHDTVMRRGFDPERNTFVQHDETTEVDASLLVLPSVGFIDGRDPRMLGTIAAVEQDLMRDGFLLRYRTQSGVDGLAGDENPFLACSFWLVAAYARAGRVDDAQRLMRRLVGLANDVGLLSEEYDPAADRMTGNFPQAFSHLALVEAAMALQHAPRTVGEE